MNWFAVALGGSLGAMARYGVATLFASQQSPKFPLATFIANVLGCFLMGLGFVLIVERGALGPVWRHLLLVGFLGAFTTYSTFSIETFLLYEVHHVWLAIFYAVVTLVSCIAAVSLAVVMSRLIF